MECILKPRCVNCHGKQGSFSPGLSSVEKEEKHPYRQGNTRHLSLSEARKLIDQRGSTPTTAISYSDVAGVNKGSFGCQD
jgi:hypothetical protein